MNQSERIEKAIISWYNANPFFYEYGLCTTFVPDAKCPTMGVAPRRGNAIRIIYNEEFVATLSDEELKGVLIHEFFHLIMNTFSRQQGRNLKGFNIATDIANNEMILDSNFCEHGKVVLPEGALRAKMIQDEGYKGSLVAEPIYDFIKQKSQENQGDGEGDEEGEGQSSGSGKGKKDSGNSMQDSFDKNFDDHSGIDEEFEPTIEEQSAMENAAKQARARAAKAGQSSGGILSLVDKLMTPQVNWRAWLKKHVSSVLANRGGIVKSTWRRPHRRDLPFSEKIRKGIKLNVAMDVSGSIGKEYHEAFFSEIEGIMKVSSKKIQLIQWDTKVLSCQPYKPGSWKTAKLECGGGTDVQDLFTYLKKHKMHKDLTVVFTDGYFNHDFDTLGISNILWVTTDQEVPKGLNIKIEL